MKVLLAGAALGFTCVSSLFVGWNARAMHDAQIIRHERTLSRKAIRTAWLRSSRPTPAACANAASLAIDAADLQARLEGDAR